MKKNKGLGEDFFLKRTGKFLFRIFFTLLVLRVVVYFYKISNPFDFPGIELKINLALLATLTLSILLLLPYKQIITILKKISSELEIRSEEELVKHVFYHIFRITLIIYLILLLSSQFKTLNFNLNYFLMGVLFLGVFSFIFPPKERKINKINVVFIVFLALIGACIVFFKTKNLGWTAYPISIISSILIFVLALLFSEKDESKRKEVTKEAEEKV